MEDFQFFGGMLPSVCLHWYLPLSVSFSLNIFNGTPTFLIFTLATFFYVLQDMTQTIPTQELAAKDLHGFEWKFKHIFRGNFGLIFQVFFGDL